MLRHKVVVPLGSGVIKVMNGRRSTAKFPISIVVTAFRRTLTRAGTRVGEILAADLYMVSH
jgi:hypothetical protein